MQKILKLTGVSVLAIVAATNANAAGYTCEELIEYTSCNGGYYLNAGECLEGSACAAGNYIKGSCPDGYDKNYEEYGEYGWCYNEEGWDGEYWYSDYTKEDCEDDGYVWFGPGCVEGDSANGFINPSPDAFVPFSYTCTPCAVGSYQNAAGQYTCNECATGTYQPESGKTSCIDAPVGNYVAGTGATSYTACATGSYQPTAGQSSCITCPAGSYCATKGLSAATLCDKGTYSNVTGAIECSVCPSTGLTDKGGTTVIATTATTGSTSQLACYVGEEYYFTDIKGTYHYTNSCNYYSSPSSVKTEEDCERLAEATGENWFWGDSRFCERVSDTTVLAPTTESECLNIGHMDEGDIEFIDGECRCNHTWIIGEGELDCAP